MESKIVKYFGGKGGGLTNKLLAYLPERETYVEPFGGSASLLLAQRSPIEIYNDVWANVYSLFCVLQDETLFGQFKRKCDLAFYSEQIRRDQIALLKNKNLSTVDRAFAYFYTNRTSHNGLGGFSCATNTSRRSMSKSVSDYLSAVDGLPEYHARLSKVIIRNIDAVDLIKSLRGDSVFIYADPPYHQSTRTKTRYNHDFTDEQHEMFLETVLASTCKILISGYDCPIYDRLKPTLGWRKERFEVNTVTGAGKPKIKIETVWFNYQKPQLTLF